MWENVEKYGKTAWGNTARAATVGLGSMELKFSIHFSISTLCNSEIQSGDRRYVSMLLASCKSPRHIFVVFCPCRETTLFRSPDNSNLLIISK